MNKAEHDRHNSLYEGYPHLRNLHRVLAWGYLDAHPLTGKSSEYGTRITTDNNPAPGAGTESQRRRYQRWQRLLGEWAERLENELDDTHMVGKTKGKRPRCYNKDTDHYGLRLSANAKFCHRCGMGVTTQKSQ